MTKRRVSVVLTFRDEIRFLGEAIESVFAQTYQDWDLTLVDDGSTDGSSELAAAYVDRHPDRVRYLDHPDHASLGPSAARNLGARRARGEFLAFLDGDDVWLPQKLSEQVAILETHADAALVYGAAEYWHSWRGAPVDDSEDVVRPIGVEPGVNHPPTVLTLSLESKAPVPWPSDFLVRRKAFERLGGFEERFPGLFDDQAFLAKVSLAFPIVASDCNWFRYRRHEGSLTSVAQGEKHAIGLVYLDWLEAYIASSAVRDEHLLRALHAKRERYEREVAGGPSRRVRRYIRALPLGRRFR